MSPKHSLMPSAPTVPVGTQIVGRYRADLEVLRIAHGFEQATGIGRQCPKIAGFAWLLGS
jgi:amidase